MVYVICMWILYRHQITTTKDCLVEQNSMDHWIILQKDCFMKGYPWTAIYWYSSWDFVGLHQIAKFMGPNRAYLGPVGPRWAQYWPHGLCYQGRFGNISLFGSGYCLYWTSNLLMGMCDCLSVYHPHTHPQTPNTPPHPTLSTPHYAWCWCLFYTKCKIIAKYFSISQPLNSIFNHFIFKGLIVFLHTWRKNIATS